MTTSRTAESIWKEASERSLTPLGERRIINRLFRAQDNSHLWPISGRFNATNRAIRRACRWDGIVGLCQSGLEYAYFLEMEISRIVNSEV